MRGSLPLTKDPEGKYITTEDGRIVEYFVYGSNNVDAKVCVLLHGSGGTGKFFNQYICQEQALVELNVRAISPSYPGHGGSDVDMFRRITDWPITDLEPILTKEGVEKFYVVGASYGTAHGMAVASSFPQRVLGLGLNAPYLPEAICRDEVSGIALVASINFFQSSHLSMYLTKCLVYLSELLDRCRHDIARNAASESSYTAAYSWNIISCGCIY